MKRVLVRGLLCLATIGCALLPSSACGQYRQTEAKSDLQAIVDKVIRAHGGEELLAKFGAQTMQAKMIYHGTGRPIPMEVSYSFQAPNRLRMEAPGSGAIIIVGDKGWANGQALPADQAAQQAEGAYVNWVASRFPLKDKAFVLMLLDEATVEGRPTVGVKVSRKGHRDIKIYFDKQTSLMAKVVTRIRSRELGKEVEQEALMGNYKDVDGIPVPMKNVVKHDGKLYLEGEVAKFKFFERLDDRVFAPTTKKAIPGDQEKIQGTWQVVSSVSNGKPLSAQASAQIRLTFTGNKLVVRNKDRTTLDGKFTLNAAKRPKELDLELDGSVGQGIYELDGDNLKIIHGEIGGKRPKTFESNEGSNLNLMLLKRSKK